MPVSLAAMGERHSKPIRESDALAGHAPLRAPDLVFTAGLSLAIVAGLALGFVLG